MLLFFTFLKDAEGGAKLNVFLFVDVVVDCLRGNNAQSREQSRYCLRPSKIGLNFSSVIFAYGPRYRKFKTLSPLRNHPTTATLDSSPSQIPQTWKTIREKLSTCKLPESANATLDKTSRQC